MIPLNQIHVSQIHVPEPCGEDWEAMDGDARRRFCTGCGCHVHDLSAMTTAQAQDLIDRTQGRLCVRFQTRPDGSPLTLDAGAGVSGAAPVAARPTFRRGSLAAAASWAVALAVTGLGLTSRADAAPQATAHAAAGHKPHAKPGPKAVPVIPARPHRLLGRIAPRHPVTPPPEKPAGIQLGQPTLTTPSAPVPPAVLGMLASPAPPPTTPVGAGSFLMGGGSAGPTRGKRP